MANRTVSVRFSEEIWQSLNALAEYEGRTVAGQVTYMVRKGLERKAQAHIAAQTRRKNAERIAAYLQEKNAAKRLAPNAGADADSAKEPE